MKRRHFLLGLATVGTGSALVVGWASGVPDLVGTREHFNQVPGETALNGWVRIAADGTVTVAVPRADMGQGISAVLAALVAEELDVPWDRVRVELPAQSRLYANTTMLLDGMAQLPAAGQGYWARIVRQLAANGVRQLGVIGTGGSSSVRDAWIPMRSAGAAARQLLIEAAASAWQVDAASCRSAAGHVTHPASGRSANYGELAPAAARRSLSSIPALRPPRDWLLLGKDFKRPDVPAKVSGAIQYGIDVLIPKGLFAAVRLAPQVGSEVLSVAADAVRAEPGVVAVVTVPGGVAVVAEQWWQARRALAKLEIRFSRPETPVDLATLRATYLQLAGVGAAQVHAHHGDQQAARAAGTGIAGVQVLERDYHLPFLAHAALEPMNCTARVSPGSCEVWMGHQIPTVLRWFAASAAGVSAEQVTFHSAPMGGSFGRRMEIDLVVQAVTIASRVPGRAVKLIWSREDDMRHDMYRPMALVRQRVAIDAQGNLLAWHIRVVTPSIVKSMLGRMLPVAATDFFSDKTAVDGALDLPYAVPALRVEHVPAPAGLPVGMWRSVGHSINAFAIESMVDELAEAAHQDPLAYRETLLAGQTRHLAVLRAAAGAAGWATPLPSGAGRGIALHASFGSIVAMVVEVASAEGRIRVRAITVAVDCGTALHPDNVRAQVEGGALFALSAALQGRISVADGAVRESNFHDYPCLRMADTPPVQVLIVNSPEAAPGGIGEVGVPPLAPALAAAIHAATGRRLRELPLAL